MDLRKNSTLIIGIAIPILMIVFVGLSIYLPALFATPPQFSFLYSSGDTYDYAWDYRVVGNKLQRIPRNVDRKYAVPGEPTFYLYDIKKQESSQLTFEQTQKLKLDQSTVSPDGYSVVRGNGGDGFFPFDFNGSNYNSFYLRGHNTSHKITVKTSDGNYWNFRFLGWVLP